MRGLTSAVATAGAPTSSSFFQLTDPVDPAQTASTGTGSSSAAESTDAVVDGSSTSSSTSPDTTGPRLDVGGSADLGDLHPAGSKGKIDLLFVISRDSSMQEYPSQIIDAFPKFIAAIESKFVAFDYHIMVIDADPHWGSSLCNEDCAPESCPIPGYPCDLLDSVGPGLRAGDRADRGRLLGVHPAMRLTERRNRPDGEPGRAE